MKNTLRNSFFILLFNCIAIDSMYSQQESQFTQFWNAKNYFNPATSGLNYKHQAYAIARRQRNNLYGQPETQLASYSMKADKLYGGIGVNYQRETIWFSTSNKVKLNYAYHLKLKNERILSIGLAAGLNTFKFDLKGFVTEPAIDSNLFPSFSDTKFTADLGFAYSQKGFNIGLSTTQINEAVHGTKYTYTETRHYFLFADYTFGNEEGFQMISQLLVKTDLNYDAIDINAMLKYKSKYYFGLTYRNRDVVGFIAGWDIQKKYRIGYSYDMTMSKLNNNFTGGSHEFVLGFLLK